jgi:hypothetical protein
VHAESIGWQLLHMQPLEARRWNLRGGTSLLNIAETR